MELRAAFPGGYSPAPFPARLLALGLDALFLVVLAAVIVQTANLALGAVTGDLFYPFWRDAKVVTVDRSVPEREHDAGFDATRIERTYVTETRRYDDGSVRIYSVVTATLTALDGTAKTLEMEFLVGRNFLSLIRLRLTEALLFLLPFLYFAVAESSRAQASLGKWALGLRVTDAEGRRLCLRRSLLRQILKVAEIASTGLGYVLAALTGRGQALHDIIARTFVVRASRSPSLGALAQHAA